MNIAILNDGYNTFFVDDEVGDNWIPVRTVKKKFIEIRNPRTDEIVYVNTWVSFPAKGRNWNPTLRIVWPSDNEG